MLRIHWMIRATCAVMVCVSLAPVASADVFNMGPNLTSLETVPVGNIGNQGELSGTGAGGYGPNRICGAVDYVYSIGTYEVTAAQYTEFLNVVGGTDTYGLYNTVMWSSGYTCKIERFAGSGMSSDPYQYRVAADWANRPVVYVSWGDAARFANWLHNGQPTGVQDLTTTEDGAYYLDGATTDAQLLAVSREADGRWAIPTEDEWYKAAFHKNDGDTGNFFIWATATDSIPSNELIDPDPGNNATFRMPGSGGTVSSPYYQTEVGAHEHSDSPYGTFDQGGNVWEWTEAIVADTSRGLRGGAANYVVRADYMMGSYLHAGVRDSRPPTDELNFGFRLVQVPDPASLSLLALGAPVLLRRRRVRRGR